MRFFAKLKWRYGKFLIVGMVCGLAGLAAGAHADDKADDKKKMVVTPFQDAKFAPLDPARPDGHQLAVLWGDPTKGPSAMLLKLKKLEGRLHLHSSDYHLVLLEGTMKHWAEGEQEADAKPLGPGSYWFQPGNQAHADSCLTDECLMFIKWEGKRDARLAEAPKK
ncbi:MAG: cupin domain-containing protein [Blastocatellia bacterium]